MLLTDIPAGIRRRCKVADGQPVGVRASTSTSRYIDERREIVSIINTAKVDLEREVVVPKGCRAENGGSMEYVTTNRQVFWGHDYESRAVALMQGAPVLRRLSLSQGGGEGWQARCVLYRTDEGNALAKICEDGGVPGASVGFIAMEYGSPDPTERKAYGPHDSIVRRWHMLEYSLTHMPMNVSCQAVPEDGALMERAAAADTEWSERLSGYVRRGVIKQKAALGLGLPARRAFPTTEPRGKRVVFLDV